MTFNDQCKADRVSPEEMFAGHIAGIHEACGNAMRKLEEMGRHSANGTTRAAFRAHALELERLEVIAYLAVRQSLGL